MTVAASTRSFAARHSGRSRSVPHATWSASVETGSFTPNRSKRSFCRCSGRPSHHLRLAGEAGQLLALVEPHDDLGGHQVDHLGDVVADALALAATPRAGPLGRRDRDGIGDAAQARRQRPPQRRLPLGRVGLSRQVLLLVDARRLSQLAVGGLQILGGRCREPLQQEQQLRRGDALVPAAPAHRLRQLLLQLAVAGHELGDQRDHRLHLPAREQLLEHLQHLASVLGLRGGRGGGGGERHAPPR
jgi:hypothetical protein